MVYVTDIPGTTSFALSIAFSKSSVVFCVFVGRNQSQINPQFAMHPAQHMVGIRLESAQMSLSIFQDLGVLEPVPSLYGMYV